MVKAFDEALTVSGRLYQTPRGFQLGAGPWDYYLVQTDYEVEVMNMIDPESVRLLPGQSMGAVFAKGPQEGGEVGLFLRSASDMIRRNGEPIVEQQAGLIRFNDVVLVLTMIRVHGIEDELFDIWWNYHARDGAESFKMMAEQDKIVLHFYSAEGKEFSVERENHFRKFFASLPRILEKAPSWSESEFDRAVRGFCAQSYPKENLWDMIGLGESEPEKAPGEVGIDDYPGHIPMDLRPFYSYELEKGHCIRVVPSMFEDKVVEGQPGEFLSPAPVKTVLRCGVRWVEGYPVAPIPFIPGHGLAVPPEDTEL